MSREVVLQSYMTDQMEPIKDKYSLLIEEGRAWMQSLLLAGYQGLDVIQVEPLKLLRDQSLFIAWRGGGGFGAKQGEI